MTETFHSISMIGLGYIGLPTAAVLARQGANVIGVDINAAAVAQINEGRAHIIETDLDALLSSVVQEGRLRAVTTPEPADAFVIAVPTPFKEGYEPDLTYIRAAAESIAPHLKPKNLVVLESTSPVGTTEQLSAWLAEARPDLTFPHQNSDDPDISVAYCPERVLPGNVIYELEYNDRIVGGLSAICSTRAANLYRIFVQGELLTTDAKTAEMAKLTENAFRDVNIAFANELSLIADRLGIDPWELISLANHHPRVNILSPGPGVGGHCIAVDPWFIVNKTPEEARLIRTAREVNDGKPHFVLGKIREAMADGGKVALLGLSYKPDIDDLRESPSMEIVAELAKDGRELLVVEPHVDALPKRLAGFENVRLVGFETALAEADILVGLVDHSVFKNVNREHLSGKRVIDTRGMWR